MLFLGSPQEAHAAASAHKVMDSLAISIVNSNAYVRVAVADAANNSVYAVKKTVTPATLARIAKNGIKYGGGPSYLAWLAIMTGAGLAYDALQDQFVTTTGMNYPGTWSSSAFGTCPIPGDGNACLDWAKDRSEQANPANTPFTWNGAAYCYNSHSSGACQELRRPCVNKYGASSCSPHSASGVRVSNSNSGAGVPTPISAPATDQQLFDAYSAHAIAADKVAAMKNAQGQPQTDLVNAPGVVEALSSAQRTQLQNDLEAGTCQPSGDAVVYELCVLGRSVGVTGAPDPATIPETVTGDGTAPDPAAEPGTDTPGDPFLEPDLEELQSFAQLTQAFVDRIAAAPLPAAVASVSSSWPSGSCPNSQLNLTGVGLGTHDLMGWGCDLWSNVIAGILSVVMIAAWSFMALRQLMSA